MAYIIALLRVFVSCIQQRGRHSRHYCENDSQDSGLSVHLATNNNVKLSCCMGNSDLAETATVKTSIPTVDVGGVPPPSPRTIQEGGKSALL
jgi:hypothetical protein